VMVVARTPWRQAVNDLLEDGEWHHINDARDVGAATVPASKAVAARRRNRDKQLLPVGRGSFAINVEDEILIGARMVVMHNINQAVRHRTIERNGHLIRLRPKP